MSNWLPVPIFILGIALLFRHDYKKNAPSTLYDHSGQPVKTKLRGRLGKHALISVIIGISAALGLFFFIAALEKSGAIGEQISDTTFNIVPGSAFNSPTIGRSPIVASYHGSHGDTISPIDIAQSIVITNRKQASAMISVLSMEVESNDWIVWKRWAPLSKIPAHLGPIFWMYDPLSQTNVKLLTFDSFLEDQISNKQFVPGQSVKGWMFYEAPSAYDSFPRPLRFRIVIEDTAGGVSTKEWAVTDLHPGATIFSETIIEPIVLDRKYFLKMYSEP